MNRRELIKQIAILTGATVAGSEFFLAGCTSHENETPVKGPFTENDISFFDDVAEAILPRTDTPGAKDADVGRFMASYSTDCYNEIELNTLREGISRLNNAAKKKYGNDLLKISPAQKQELLTEVDTDAKKYNDGKGQSPPHYFTLMKQMVLLGFFTSKPGVTKVLRWIPVPGKYLGCVDYKDGDTSWV